MNSQKGNSNGKRKGRFLLKWGLIGGGGAALLAILGVGIYFRLLESRADRVYELGKEVNSFFSEYSKAFKKNDSDTIVSLYQDGYDGDEHQWKLERVAEDLEKLSLGVNVFSVTKGESLGAGKEAVRKQVDQFFEMIPSVDFSKFKVEQIEEDRGDSATVKTILWLRGESGANKIEKRIQLRFELVKNGDQQWKIGEKELLGGRSVIGAGNGFVDVASESGIDFKAQANPMLKGTKWEKWIPFAKGKENEVNESTFASLPEEAKQTIEKERNQWKPSVFEIMQYAHGGVSVADYDGDGHDDIFFPDGEYPRLFRNTGDGMFVDQTKVAFADSFGATGFLPGCSVGLLVDFDNDGDLDLFIGRSTAGNKLFANNGDGTFSEVHEGASVPAFAKNPRVGVPDGDENGEWVAVASAADFNNDGLVDLYLGRYLDPRKKLPTTLFYTRNSEGNSLLMNNGDLTFTDVTDAMGVREGGLSLGTTWGDYDHDGDQDLYVANDFGQNAFFENQGPAGGTDENGFPKWKAFKEISAENGTVDISYGMSATFADLDNDADLDLYVSNVHSGQRWFGNKATLKHYIATTLRQNTFFEDAEVYRRLDEISNDKWNLGDRVIRGNSMFMNNGSKQFIDTTEAAGVNPHGWFWGSLVFDFDNDGFQDIYAVNGWISGKVPDDL